MVFLSRPFCPKSGFKIPICLKTRSESGNGATHPRVPLGQDILLVSFLLRVGNRSPNSVQQEVFLSPKSVSIQQELESTLAASLHRKPWHVLIEQDPLRILRWCWNFKFLQHVALHGIGGRLFLNSFWWKFLLLSPLLLFLCLWFSPHHQVALCLQTNSGLSERCWCSH